MIYDVTGTVITPGNFGLDCLGNGFHKDENGNIIECCCDECDYLLCCTDPNYGYCYECTIVDCKIYRVFHE